MHVETQLNCKTCEKKLAQLEGKSQKPPRDVFHQHEITIYEISPFMYVHLSVCLSVWLPACLPGRVGSRRVALRRVGSGRVGPGRAGSGRGGSSRGGSGRVGSGLVCLSSAFSYTVMWLMIMVKITTDEINIVS